MTLQERMTEVVKTCIFISMVLFLGFNGNWEVAYLFGYVITILKIWIEHGRPNIFEVVLFFAYPATWLMTITVLLFFPDFIEDENNNPDQHSDT